MLNSSGSVARVLFERVPEKQGALRASFGLIGIVIRDVLDPKPGQDPCENQIPDQNDECHNGPRDVR
jgi:hypothetical protein